MTNSLPKDVQAIIRAKIESGEYSSESDVVAAGVRLLSEEEQQRTIQTERLRTMIQEAVDEFDRGEWQDMDEAFDEVEIELFGKRLADPGGSANARSDAAAEQVVAIPRDSFSIQSARELGFQ